MAIGTSKLSRKGQVTIPKQVREQLGLEAGDDLIIVGVKGNENVEETIIIRKPNLDDYIKEAEKAYRKGRTVSHQELFGSPRGIDS